MRERVGKNLGETLRMFHAEFPQVRPWTAAVQCYCRCCGAPAGKPCFGRGFANPHATRYRAGLRALRAEPADPAPSKGDEHR